LFVLCVCAVVFVGVVRTDKRTAERRYLQRERWVTITYRSIMAVLSLR